MKKKLSSLLVALMMVMTMIPSMAFAEDGDSSGSNGGTSATSPKSTWIAIDETNFPDPEFRKYVAEEFDDGSRHYDEDLGSWIDADSPANDGYLCETEIKNATSIYISDSYVEDIKGVELLTSLEYIDVENNYISNIQELPDSITTLDLSGNSLERLPKLPSGLEELRCGNNKLTSLPQLPQGLTTLSCWDNKLTSLPQLPSNLAYLSCSNNQLITLPELPNTLTELACYNNKNLTSLPALPENLKSLAASNCSLTSIPSLPPKLTSIHLGYNKLTGVLDTSGLHFLKYVSLYENILTGLKVSDKAKYEDVNLWGNFMASKDAVTGRDDIDWDNVFDFGWQKTYCEAYGHTLSSKVKTDKAYVGQSYAYPGSEYRQCTKCDYDTSWDDKDEVIPAVKSIKLSSTSYTYNGKTIKPTVTVYDTNNKKLSASNYTVKYASGCKNVGKYKVTVTFKGDYYTGSRYVTFNINPKGTSLSSVAASSKAFTAKWKKQSGKMATSRITGYQIRYSTSSDMAASKTSTIKGYTKTSKKITKLQAKKKYYVQVRTYKTVSGKNYYSSWSKAKPVTTK